MDFDSEAENILKAMNAKIDEAADFIMDMDCLYGTFFLGEDEFTFHIKEMQEIVNFPEHVSCLPLMPDYVFGVFNLRETIVPLIDMRSLLDMEPSDEEAKRFVAIVSCHGQLIGVIIDRTGDVLTIDEDEIAIMKQKASHERSALIRGIANLQSGKRLIRVITANSLVEMDDMLLLEQKEAESVDYRDAYQQLGASGIGQTAISFSSGHTDFAMPVDKILEVLENPQLEASHVSYDNCIGILNLRGTLISVIDFQAAMGGPEKEDPEKGMVIIAITGGQYCGFLVDEISDVINFEERSLLPIPALKDNARKGCLKGIVSLSEEKNIFLLDADNLCQEDDILQSIEANSIPDALEEEGADSEEAVVGKNASSASSGASDDLKVYITFRLGKTLALEILEVTEIITYPKELMQPPGYEGFIRGMLNLRGTIIPMIDMRKYYGLEDYESLEEASILIVRREGSLYGLIVDAVEDSIDVYSSQTTIIPKVVNDGANTEFKGDVSEILEYTSLDGETQMLMVYSVDNLLERLVGQGVA